ncbi:MAG: primosomal protein N' [Deltaproteobacteria bacterium]|nr:primosomal protein N' [Deltaproteobacteria bacterium]
MTTTCAVVEVVIPDIPLSLTYCLPEHLAQADAGWQVVVEVSNKTKYGWIIKKLSLAEYITLQQQEKKKKQNNSAQFSLFGEQTLKEDKKQNPPLKPIQEAEPSFHADQLTLFNWIAEYYGANLAYVVDSIVPTISQGRQETVINLTKKGYALLADRDEILKFSKRAKKQWLILNHLTNCQLPISGTDLGTYIKYNTQTLKSLAEQELISLSKTYDILKSLEQTEASDFVFNEPKQLTNEQGQAIAKIQTSINAGQFAAFLLDGVTGSGKTEVYLQAIKTVLGQQKTILLVVPEIALTPQLIDRFRSRLPVPIGVLHSQVSKSLRWQTWKGALEGKVQVIIGARSAIFAPLKNIGLIVVDEEHDSSFKQNESFRYQARDIAVMRAKFTNCPIIMGSATPSFESLNNCLLKRYHYLRLANRATTHPLPTVEIVDLNKVKSKEMLSTNISPTLFQSLVKVINKQEQAMILYNRRGFASYLQCTTCGQVVSCPNCSVSYTYHKKNHKLICHYCSHSQVTPSYCPICRDQRLTKLEDQQILNNKNLERKAAQVGNLMQRGGGTEKIYDELKALFPLARIERLDRDVTTGKDAHREILEKMRKHEIDILVGTQMIAKGHDLPNVTLVGIIDADIALHLPDFRSSEKTLQLLMQASGRAGRGEHPGIVVIQTREPKHPALLACQQDNYSGFVKFELNYRKGLNYPPYVKLLRLIVASKSALRAETFAGQYANLVRSAAESLEQKNGADNQIQVLGPSLAPIEKIENYYRWHLLIKCSSPATISHLAKIVTDYYRDTYDARQYKLTIDVDPSDML